MQIDSRSFDKRLRIERKLPDDAADSAGSETWEPVGKAWASVQDVLPSRSEKLADGLNIATRPARVRMNFRTDITSDMRFVAGSRVMQIVSGPAELGARQWLEFMVEDYSTAGNG